MKRTRKADTPIPSKHDQREALAHLAANGVPLDVAASLPLSYLPTVTFLYRVLENDDDGDPLDWGALTLYAPDTTEAIAEALAKRFASFGLEEPVDVAIYDVTPSLGVWQSVDDTPTRKLTIIPKE